MKKYGAIILIVGLSFYLAYMLFSQEAFSNKRQSEPQDQSVQRNQRDQTETDAETGNSTTVGQKKLDLKGNEGGSEEVEDENYFVDDQEIFDRKSYQKQLPPLSDKEKIIWAFRLSKTTIFL